LALARQAPKYLDHCRRTLGSERFHQTFAGMVMKKGHTALGGITVAQGEPEYVLKA
jgi:hypothetical protein